MNTAQADAVALAADVVRGESERDGRVGVAICPPFVWLDGVAERTEGHRVELGAQDVSGAASGAYTGEVSAAMLAEVGCTYVIVGHSERRSGHDETDDLISRKAATAQAHGLTPIVCVGESLEQRRADQQEAVVTSQLSGSLAGLDPERLVVAYEPVWAIGTGETATPEQAQDLHRVVRMWLRDAFGEAASRIPLLYGGSVKPANALDLFRQSDVDGGLIGGASLKADDFLAIVDAAAQVSGG